MNFVLGTLRVLVTSCWELCVSYFVLITSCFGKQLYYNHNEEIFFFRYDRHLFDAAYYCGC